ncbi:MAG: hypothetical protein ABGW69_02960 [Nanoarchaeota archaeon]
MKILFFADPEGELQKRKKKILKLVEEFNPDTITFAGDYFPGLFLTFYIMKNTKRTRISLIYFQN